MILFYCMLCTYTYTLLISIAIITNMSFQLLFTVDGAKNTSRNDDDVLNTMRNPNIMCYVMYMRYRHDGDWNLKGNMTFIKSFDQALEIRTKSIQGIEKELEQSTIPFTANFQIVVKGIVDYDTLTRLN